MTMLGAIAFHIVLGALSMVGIVARAIAPSANVDSLLHVGLTSSGELELQEGANGTGPLRPNSRTGIDKPDLIHVSSSPGLVQLTEVKSSATHHHSQQLNVLGSSTSSGFLVDDLVTGCGHNLTGVGDDAVRFALAHDASYRAVKVQPELRSLQNQRFFIAACLHQSEVVLPHWIAELLRLVLSLRQNDPSGVAANLFVSIYESGSTDQTGMLLSSLQSHLRFLRVPHRIERGDLVRGTLNRIAFLAHVRNLAMEPLHRIATPFDRILWLNDIFFCADGVLQLAFNTLPTPEGIEADAACGMDYVQYSTVGEDDVAKQECGFYDIWVAHDIDGNNFNVRDPIASSSATRQARHLPFQVFSCWNGMAIFAADIFQQHRLSFRRNNRHLSECAASETELLFRDMWKLGRGRSIVTPVAASAYNAEDFQACVLPSQPTAFYHQSPPLTFKAAPQIVSCCPIEEHGTQVDFSACFSERWDRFVIDGIPVTKSIILRYQSEICGVAAIILCALGAIHVYNIQWSHPSACMFVAVCSSVLLEILNQVVLAAMPLPLALFAMQLLIASIILLGTRGTAVIHEITQNFESAVSWSLIIPLSVLGFLTFGAVLRAQNYVLVMAVQNALPLCMLVFEPHMFHRATSVNIWSLLSLHCLALSTAFYAIAQLSHLPRDLFAPALALLNGILILMRQSLMRHLFLSKRTVLSFEALALLDNGLAFAFVGPAVVGTIDMEMLTELVGSIHKGCIMASCILLSGCARLCMTYYRNVVQSKFSVTSALVLQTTKTLLIISLTLLVNPIKVNGCWCLFTFACVLVYACTSRLTQHTKDRIQDSKQDSQNVLFGNTSCRDLGGGA